MFFCLHTDVPAYFHCIKTPKIDYFLQTITTSRSSCFFFNSELKTVVRFQYNFFPSLLFSLQPAVRHEACNGLYKLSLSGLEGGESINRSFLLLAASTLLKFLPDAQALKPLRVGLTHTHAHAAASYTLCQSSPL